MPGFKDLSLFFDCRGHGSPKGEQQDVKMQTSCCSPLEVLSPEVLSPQMDPPFQGVEEDRPGRRRPGIHHVSH